MSFYNRTQEKYIQSEADGSPEFLQKQGWSEKDEIYWWVHINGELRMQKYNNGKWILKVDKDVEDIIEIMADYSLNAWVDEFI